MVFSDRNEAARQLAERLAEHKGERPLVLAIPRGAVPMGRIIADELDGQLDVVLVRKIGTPGNPEFALGAVDEAGELFLAGHALAHADKGYIAAEAVRQKQTIARRRAEYTPVRPAIDPQGRVVIVVDDGVATGSTLIAALRAVRARKPARLIAAVAVAPPETIERLRKEADEVVCLLVPNYLGAVGQFFMNFAQVEDAEVIRLLGEGQAAACKATSNAG